VKKEIPGLRHPNLVQMRSILPFKKARSFSIGSMQNMLEAW
jgi:hypothetical protein